jgi:hypothetical protein
VVPEKIVSAKVNLTYSPQAPVTGSSRELAVHNEADVALNTPEAAEINTFDKL